jgi:hypothetical protein
MTENGWGKERKINSKPAMLNLVTGEEGELKQNLWQNEWLFKIYFIHAASPCTVA